MSEFRYAPLLATLLLASGLAATLASCVAPEEAGLTPTVTPTDTPTPVASSDIGFAGATEAVNLDGTRIQISWSAGTGTFTYYRVYETQSDDSLAPVIRLPKTATNFIHAGLTAGTSHSYVVRTVDDANATDGNNVVVSAMTYGGLSSTSGVGQTSATLNFPAGKSAARVKLYCSERGAAPALMATVTSTATSATLTGLKPGTTYVCKALAQSLLGFEDANTVTKTFQTVPTHTAKYKGPILVQAFGAAGDASWIAPSGQPSARQVTITWKPFAGANATTLYKLVRVAKDGVIDTTVTNTCTAGTNSSCVVQCPASATTGNIVSYDSSNLVGSAPKTCTDKAVAASPAKYDYYITEVVNDWIEESPNVTNGGDSAYRITVPIPPHDMVLVHRDAVNYEICNLMGKYDMDPLNHQRCAYTGLGAVPTNSNPGNPGLNLDPSHYDFGYNLFVDRWAAACNWSPSAATAGNTGKCGAGRTNGDCFGTGTPSASIGVDGNVFYQWDQGYCYVNVAQTWIGVGSPGPTGPQRLQSYTNTPSTAFKKPPMTSIGQKISADTCAAAADPDYGPKRLLRRREQIAASAWPYITGEPRAMTDNAIQVLEIGTDHPNTHACNSNQRNGVSVTGTFNDSGYELARSTAAGPDAFVIGSAGTSNCVSRYGVQDMVGNVGFWLSDQLDTCTPAAHTCSGATSTVDSGNTDLNGFQFDGLGGATGNHGPGGGAANITGWYLATNTFSTNYFSLPLGMSLVGNDNGNALLTTTFGTSGAKMHGDYVLLYTDNYAGGPRGAWAGGYWWNGDLNGRYMFWMNGMAAGAGWQIGFRCAVPAE
ncbi:fibronectin type III domain-containing protein [Bdellovibrionota bacterium FG-1]